MKQTIENCVGFWGKVRFSVSSFDSNRSLQTLFFRDTSRFVAGFTSALLFHQLADIALYTKKIASSRWPGGRTGTIPRCH